MDGVSVLMNAAYYQHAILMSFENTSDILHPLSDTVIMMKDIVLNINTSPYSSNGAVMIQNLYNELIVDGLIANVNANVDSILSYSHKQLGM